MTPYRPTLLKLTTQRCYCHTTEKTEKSEAVAYRTVAPCKEMPVIPVNKCRSSRSTSAGHPGQPGGGQEKAEEEEEEKNSGSLTHF
jgi:hypothetical protein